MAESGSLTVYPGAYDASASSFKSISGATNPVGKGSENTTYATINSSDGGPVSVFWPFDLSAIPENATINSVSCKAKAKVASTAGVKDAQLQLFSGATSKGTSASFKSTTEIVYTLTTGSWTRAELEAIRLRVYGTSMVYGIALRFYGADLTVTYTYQSEKFMLKLGGSWEGASRVFKKVSGIWVEQESLEGVVDTSKKLVNGGEIN